MRPRLLAICFSLVCFPAPAAEQGMLYVETEPHGAVVLVDGTFRGESPLLVKNLRPGSHKVELRLKGYSKLSEVVTIEPGKLAKLELDMEPLAGPAAGRREPKPSFSLKIRCNVRDAKVYVDGEETGKVNEYIQVQPGPRSIAVVHDGYWDREFTLTVPKSGRNVTSIPLVPGVSMWAGRIPLVESEWGLHRDARGWRIENGMVVFDALSHEKTKGSVTNPRLHSLGDTYLAQFEARVETPGTVNFAALNGYGACRVPKDGKWHTAFVAVNRAESVWFVDGERQRGRSLDGNVRWGFTVWKQGGINDKRVRVCFRGLKVLPCDGKTYEVAVASMDQIPRRGR